MEQKIFEFMEKLYSEMQNGFAKVNSRLDNLEEGQGKVEKQVAQIENDLKPNVEAALDGYKVVYDKMETLETKVDKLTEIVENHDVEIQVIRKVK